MSVFIYEAYECSTSKSAVQECVLYNNLVGPKAHNTIHVNSLPQTQDGCETNLRLSTKVRRRPLGCDLVKISTS